MLLKEKIIGLMQGILEKKPVTAMWHSLGPDTAYISTVAIHNHLIKLLPFSFSELSKGEFKNQPVMIKYNIRAMW